MFNNPVKPDSRQDEGTVMQIDVKRSLCKVITLSGQKMDNVQWLQPYGGNDRHGDRVTPRLGDRVMLSYGLGYPVIIGSLPRAQTGSQSYPLSLGSGVGQLETGNYAPGDSSLSGDASKPQDMLLGDRVIGSQGGGVIALLRAGSVLLRSSRSSEIFLSRLGDLVRVVSRNFEHFTDLGTDVYRNFQGRVYRYFGVSNAASKSLVENYQYHQYYGDTVAAEAVKAGYHNPPQTVPASSNVIFKEQVSGAGNAEIMRRTVDLTGAEEVYITNGSTFTRMRATNGVITLSFGDQHVITVDQDKVQAHHGGGANLVLNAEGVTSTFGSGKVEMKSDGVRTTFSGHFCNVTSSGVQLG